MIPQSPTSTSAVGSRSARPTFSPRARAAVRSSLRLDQSSCSFSCWSRYFLYLSRSISICTCGFGITRSAYAKNGLLALRNPSLSESLCLKRIVTYLLLETITLGSLGSGTIGSLSSFLLRTPSGLNSQDMVVARRDQTMNTCPTVRNQSTSSIASPRTIRGEIVYYVKNKRDEYNLY